MFVFALLLGAVFGSFANAVAWRLHTGRTLGGRSMCPKCKVTLGPTDLIPIISWTVLKGKCRSCQGRISWHYPAAEVAGAILFSISFYRFDVVHGSVAQFVFEMAVLILLLIFVFMDLRWKELPLELMLIGTGAIMVAQLAVFHVYGIWLISGMFISAVFFGAQWILSKGKWIGTGDIFLTLFLAAAVGGWSSVLLGIYFSYLFGGVVAAILLLARVIKRGDTLPFAPFLAVGFLSAWWFGEGVLMMVRNVLPL